MRVIYIAKWIQWGSLRFDLMVRSPVLEPC